MVLEKALPMGSNSFAQEIVLTSGPSNAEALSRAVGGLGLSIWDKYCDGMVERANMLEFS